MQQKTNMTDLVAPTSAETIKRRLGRLFLRPLFAVALAGFATLALAQGNYYRFQDDKGVKHMGYSVPPEYVKYGYEVVSPVSGRVIDTIAPAPDPDEVEKARAKAQMKADYELLEKRYSSLLDIEAAKKRKLQNVEAGIQLGETSLSQVKKEIDNLYTQAAGFERAGKAVPSSLMTTLSGLEAQKSSIEATLAVRQAEKTEIEKKSAQERTLMIDGARLFDPKRHASITAYLEREAEKAQRAAEQAKADAESTANASDASESDLSAGESKAPAALPSAPATSSLPAARAEVSPSSAVLPSSAAPPNTQTTP